MIRRPTGISVLALLNLFSASLALVMTVAGIVLAAGSNFTLGEIAVFVAIMAVSLAISYAVFWGLWTLHSWARSLTIVFSAFGLLAFPVGTIVNALILWYLFQPHVKKAFGEGPIKFSWRRQEGPGTETEPKPDDDQPTSQPPNEASPAVAFVSAWLVDELSGESYQLRKGDTRLGRGSGNDLVLADSTISREHALIREQNGLFTLFDRASTYGTQVNDQRVQGPVMLQHGDVVQMGETRLQLVCRE